MEELIRSKLEGAEITPSPGAWKGVQRQLRIRKFMRFDPGTFNAWYLGGALLVAAAVVSLISINTPERETLPGPSVPLQNPEEPVTEQARESGFTENRQQADQPVETGPVQAMESKTLTGDRSGPEDELASGLREPSGTGPGQGAREQLPAEIDPGPGQPLQQILVTYFTPSVQSGCAPLEVSFINTSINAVSFTWSFGTGEVTTENSPRYTFTEPGNYTVTLQAEGRDGLSESHHQLIRVYPVPGAGFEIGEGLQGAEGLESLELMNYSTGAFSYAWDLLSKENLTGERWSSNEFQPSLKTGELPRDASWVRLVAVNNYGCSDTAVVEIPGVNGSQELTLRFPTVFSPNNTGPTGGMYSPHEKRTDLFHPHFSRVPAEYHLKVFTRMGELVFESRDIYVGWDGYYLQERTAGGVYLWVAEGTWENGESYSLKGDVTLLWNDRWP